MAATATYPTTMIKAYTINMTGAQVLSESTVVIACSLPRKSQPENEFEEDAAPYVVEAARQYLSNNGEGASSLQKLEDISKVAEANSIVCAFAEPAEASLNLIESAETRNSMDFHLLARFLNAGVWEDLANIWNLDMDIRHKMHLSSGNTCLPLRDFKVNIQHLVNENVAQYSYITEAMKRTAFWKHIAEPEVSTELTGSSYTHKSDGRNTFPRMSGSARSRPRVVSDTSPFIPRSMS